MELQAKIWKEAIPKTPRIIKIKIHPRQWLGDTSPVFSTDTQPSPLLSACKVSREEVLKVYKVCIRSKDCKRKIRFDGVNDIMMLWAHNAYIDNLSTFEYLPAKTFAGVEKSLSVSPVSCAAMLGMLAASQVTSIKTFLFMDSVNWKATCKIKELWHHPRVWTWATKMLSNEKIEENVEQVTELMAFWKQRLEEKHGVRAPSFEYVSLLARDKLP